MKPNPEIIAALDVEDGDAAMRLVEILRGNIKYFKLGSRLFTATGPGMIDEIAATGARIFIDLKFHDIPATVSGAVKAACRPGIGIMTLHTCGGVEMMKAAAQAAREEASRKGIEKPHARLLAAHRWWLMAANNPGFR